MESITDDPLNAEEFNRKEEPKALVRTTKSIVIREDEGKGLDPTVISSRFFNAFSHTLVSPDQAGSNVSIGVTSAHPGEGKTIVAANIAVSTALSMERDTILVDFNFRYPRLHSTFGLDIRPGLADALTDPEIYIAKTKIKHLYVLTAGNVRRLGIMPELSKQENPKTNGSFKHSGLTFLTDFRDVLYSIQHEFGFVIVDMPAASDPSLPALFAQQLHGLLVVIDTKRTTKENIDYVLTRFGADRVRGFVLNRIPGGP